MSCPGPVNSNLYRVLLQTELEQCKRKSPIVGGGLMGSGQYPCELGSIRCMQRPQHQLKRQACSQDFNKGCYVDI